jgi:hypothetical protein
MAPAGRVGFSSPAARFSVLRSRSDFFSLSRLLALTWIGWVSYMGITNDGGDAWRRRSLL